MNLEQYAKIAEIISGFAVVVSLLLLVREIRDNSELIGSATYDSLVAEVSDWNAVNSTDDSLAEMNFVLSSEGADALSPRQAKLRQDMTISLYQIYERAFIQWELGHLDDEEWERFRAQICSPRDQMFRDFVEPRLESRVSSRFNSYRIECTPN